jgi:CRP-like cAMP-binding protein
MTLQDTLRHSKFFESLADNMLETLAASAFSRHCLAGEFLFLQDDVASHFYVVLNGRFRLIQHSTIGKDVTMAIFVPGDLIGIVVALSGSPYPGSVETVEDGDVIGIPGEAIWNILQFDAALAVRVLRMVAERLHIAHNRIRELSVERVNQRIARSLLRLAGQLGVKEPDGSIRLDVNLSRQDLAQMNGTTLESVSRALTAFEREGIIRADRKQEVVILKPHQLVIIAEDLPT